MNTNPPSVANIPRVGGPRPPPPGAIASSLLSLPNIFLIVSTIYTVILLVFYATQRHATIPLSHRTYFDDWGGLRALLSASADTNASVTWEELNAVIWCPHGRLSSPQCGCFHDFYHQTYTRGIESVRVGNTTWAQIGTTYADEGWIPACARAPRGARIRAGSSARCICPPPLSWPACTCPSSSPFDPDSQCPCFSSRRPGSLSCWQCAP